ncbi:MAG: UbiH/UbiF/VisC/COQ6 family ubiquinone biosynthesis hydroxylase [Alphaproteobacteria bacterium]
MSDIHYDYDVIIVGGGLAGLSLSCLLGKFDGLKVACLDRDAPEDQLRSDERTTAISYGSSQVLQRAGVWDDIVSAGCPIENIEILDGDSPLLLQFLSSEVEGKAFGWIISNRHIRKSLMNAMGELPNVDHIAPACVRDFDVTDDQASVILDNGRKISARLVIGADGRMSGVRDFMDVPVRKWSYNQRAVVCFVIHENPHDNKAVEHFWPSGPFAILPMPNLDDGRHISSLVFTEHEKRKKQSLMDLNDEEFSQKVEQGFPESYGTVEILDNKRMAFPLSLVHASEYIAPRMVLVADAAHGIHPIAGQGLNLGFRDLGVLATLIEQAVEAGQDIGSVSLLEAYQRKRRPDNMAMIAFTDAMVRLFSNNLLPVKILRRTGLKAVARLSHAKQFFMRRAMGE